MVIYADTSFLVALYSRDAHHERAVQVAKGLDGLMLWSALQRHEVTNAFRLAVFRRDIKEGECLALLDGLEADLRSGFFQLAMPAWEEIFQVAEQLSRRHSTQLGIRGMDLLHVAAAQVLGAELFLTFDRRQRKLAEKAGLKTGP